MAINNETSRVFVETLITEFVTREDIGDDDLFNQALDYATKDILDGCSVNEVINFRDDIGNSVCAYLDGYKAAMKHIGAGAC